MSSHHHEPAQQPADAVEAIVPAMPIVLPVVDNKIMYCVAIAAGTVVTALTINTLKKVWKAPGEGAAA